MARTTERPRLLRVAVAVLAVAVSLGFGLYFRPGTYSTPYLYFYPAVLLALWYGGFASGLLATLLSAIVVDVFFLPPLGFSVDLLNVGRGLFFCLSFGLICWLIDRRTVRAEAAIERQLRLLDIAFEPIIMRDPQDRIVLWNRGAERLYGWTKQEAAGQVIHELLKTVFPKPLSAIQSDLKETGHWSGELQHTTKGGNQLAVASWWTLDQGKTNPGTILEANFDLSERKRAEEALIRTEKLASVGRLAATIAHEVNNPLAGAMNAVFLASQDASVSAEARDNLALADQELRRAAHITAQTLVFCRESSTRQRLQLPSVVTEVLGIYRKRIQDRGIRVHQRYRCGPCHATCDCVTANPVELRQIISNLMGNVLDAVNHNGTMHVRVCRMSGSNGGAKVRLTIADNGCGIPTENLKRIFEPFFTTKESVGTGLGLWISEQIIHRYGGSLRVRSQPGKGSVFVMTLPAALADAEC